MTPELTALKAAVERVGRTPEGRGAWVGLVTISAVDRDLILAALSRYDTPEMEAVLRGNIQTAWRRGGGIPSLSRTKQGRDFLLASAVAEASALSRALGSESKT